MFVEYKKNVGRKKIPLQNYWEMERIFQLYLTNLREKICFI